MSRCLAAAAFVVLWWNPATAWSHAGTFILAKCSTDPAGAVSLELTVDCAQHPTLTDRAAAITALRGALMVVSSEGPLAVDSLAMGVAENSTVPDSEIPVSEVAKEEGRSHDFVRMRYSWHPGVPEIRFTVPTGNPHDILFWLSGAARPATGPVPWRILIAGDVSPPVPVPQLLPPQKSTQPMRWAMAALIGLLVAAAVRWRQVREQAVPHRGGCPER